MLARMKIAARLMIGFGLLVIIIAGLSGFSVYLSRDSRDTFQNVVRLKSNEVLSQRAQKRVMEGRLAVWMALATDDQSKWELADKAFKTAHQRLDELVASTVDPKRLASAKALKAQVADYEAKAAKLKAFRGKNGALDTPEGKAVATEAMASGGKVDAIAEPISDEYKAAAGAATSAAVDSLALGIMIAMIAGSVSVLLGLGLAFVVSRSITIPVKSMTAVMGLLAKGDLSTVIPATENKDEIGDMARAVMVFKDNMVKADQLAAEQKAEQAKKEQRQVAIEGYIATFETGVRGSLDTLASAATEMRATSQSMSATAEETSAQATTVAAAAEQASANVQTVATATEELSSSVAEIGRQVTESTKIAGQAVDEAGRTNVTVQGLSAAAQKIGDVVKLISDIASQTNLLALNATIEAARAGDAGKGFAVVASEVKSLANQTAKATEEISAQVAAMQGATSEAVQAIQSIGGTIGTINEIATTIASAVEEQGAATQEIARNVQEAAQGTGQVSSNIVGVNQAAGETGAAASQVLASAEELGKQAETLRADVGSFLANIRAA
jgi:methyl-accepting chemotaxis protein